MLIGLIRLHLVWCKLSLIHFKIKKFGNHYDLINTFQGIWDLNIKLSIGINEL